MTRSMRILPIGSIPAWVPALVLALITTAAAGSPVAAQPPYPTRFSAELVERPAVAEVLAWIESNFPAQIREWIRITEIPAPSGQEQARGAYIRAQFEQAGYPVEIDAIGNVIARRPGTGGGPTVVLAAHMDTVHPLGTDVTVRREEGLLKAPGVFDNSMSVANMLAVARALDAAGVRTRGDLIFIATAQEEVGLLGMAHWLDHNPDVADMLIALDGGLPNVNYGALGIYWTRYFFRGAGSHTNTSAGRPHPGRAMAEAVTSIYRIEIPEEPGGAVINVGMFGGGLVFNAIAQEVWFTMDLRSVNPGLLEHLDRQIEERVAEAAARHGVTWAKEEVTRNPAGGTEEMLRERRAHPLVQTAVDVHGHFGFESRAVASGSTDANAGVIRGIPSISIGRGRGGDQHTLSEWAEEASALPATRVTLLLAISLAGPGGPP